MIGENGLDETFKAVQSKVMVVAFSSDWLYTPKQNQLIVESLQRLGKEASYVEIDHMHGHDSFLINSKDFLSAVRLSFPVQTLLIMVKSKTIMRAPEKTLRFMI